MKKKLNPDGTVDEYKGCLVVKDFRQRGYFSSYFSPLTRITSTRIQIWIDATYNFIVEQIDIKINFLNGDLDEEI